MIQTTEEVVLVSEDGAPLGVADKVSVHSTETPLHLAFSCHVYNAAGEVLVTRRSLDKLTWPGVWTNSFCGHPAPGEAIEQAVHRKAEQELGLALATLEPLLPHFRYRAVDASGIVENEICPVFRATVTDDPAPNPHEVSEYFWAPPSALRVAVTATPRAFSPWLVLQLSEWVE